MLVYCKYASNRNLFLKFQFFLYCPIPDFLQLLWLEHMTLVMRRWPTLAQKWPPHSEGHLLLVLFSGKKGGLQQFRFSHRHILLKNMHVSKKIKSSHPVMSFTIYSCTILSLLTHDSSQRLLDRALLFAACRHQRSNYVYAPLNKHNQRRTSCLLHGSSSTPLSEKAHVVKAREVIARW